MAQIFASDRTQTRPTASASRLTKSRANDPLRALQSHADTSVPTKQLTQLKARLTGVPLQRVEEEEALQGKFSEPLQRMEDEDMLQGKFTNNQTADTIQQKTSKGELPPRLRTGIEQLSGTDMSSVRVHYNSSAPAQMQAHAFAQGNNIHVGPGQEKHVPHEAWHVVQQQQGRVKPTTEMGGIEINDDPALEREADTMGAKAMNLGGSKE